MRFLIKCSMFFVLVFCACLRFCSRSEPETKHAVPGRLLSDRSMAEVFLTGRLVSMLSYRVPYIQLSHKTSSSSVLNGHRRLLTVSNRRKSAGEGVGGVRDKDSQTEMKDENQKKPRSIRSWLLHETKKTLLARRTQEKNEQESIRRWFRRLVFEDDSEVPSASVPETGQVAREFLHPYGYEEQRRSKDSSARQANGKNHPLNSTLLSISHSSYRTNESSGSGYNDGGSSYYARQPPNKNPLPRYGNCDDDSSVTGPCAGYSSDISATDNTTRPANPPKEGTDAPRPLSSPPPLKSVPFKPSGTNSPFELQPQPSPWQLPMPLFPVPPSRVPALESNVPTIAVTSATDVPSGPSNWQPHPSPDVSSAPSNMGSHLPSKIASPAPQLLVAPSVGPHPTTEQNSMHLEVSVLQSSVIPHNLSQHLAGVMNSVLSVNTPFRVYPATHIGKGQSEVMSSATRIFLVQDSTDSQVTVLRSLSNTTSWRRYEVGYKCYYFPSNRPIATEALLQQIYAISLSAVEASISTGSFLHQLAAVANESHVDVLYVARPGTEDEFVSNPAQPPRGSSRPRTYRVPLSTNGFDARRWVGLLVILITNGGALFLMYLGAHREKKLKQDVLWGVPWGNDQEVGNLLNLGFMWQQGNNGPPKGIIVFNKEKVGYRDEDSTLMGGFYNPNMLMNVAADTLPSSDTSRVGL